MSSAKDVEFSLKVVINKEKTKVLFAEADSDFTDVLLSFLTLPLGQIVKLLAKHYGDHVPVVGSLNTLYDGLAKMSTDYFVTEGGMQMVINPRSWLDAECRKLKLNINDSEPTKYFVCEEYWSCKKSCVGVYYDSARCDCGKALKREIKFKASSKSAVDVDSGVFSKKLVFYIICDDMRMVPIVGGSILKTLSEVGVTDTKGSEIRNVSIGYNEIIGLLKGMLVSQTPLTDVILGRRENDFASPKPELVTYLHKTGDLASSNSNNMKLEVVLQKSTGKLLFAQADEDFVDLLCSFLTIPLGGVESLLGSSSSISSLDNFYRSIGTISGGEYFRTKDTKDILLKPKLPHGYISQNNFLPLTEEIIPPMYLLVECLYVQETRSLSPIPNKENCTALSLKSPKDNKNFVKGLTMYLVTDDLTVTPSFVTSSLSVLNVLGIPLSDVEELELNIGLEEALMILKASITSTTALSDSLNKSLVKKRVKQEVISDSMNKSLVKKRVKREV